MEAIGGVKLAIVVDTWESEGDVEGALVCKDDEIVVVLKFVCAFFDRTGVRVRLVVRLVGGRHGASRRWSSRR